jgi:hypothetical protein
MAEASHKVRILVIRTWTEPIGPLRAALAEAGLDVRIVRVDIEPALNAALDREYFEAIVFDPRTPNITRAMLDEQLWTRQQRPAVIVFESITDAVERIKHVVAQLLN